MAIDEAVTAWLLAESTITDLIGQRLYPDKLPQKELSGSDPAAVTLPAMTYEIVFTDEEDDINGPHGFAHSRFTFTAYADTRRAANSVVRALKAAARALSKGVTEGVDIRSVRIASGVEYLIEQPTDSSQADRYLALMDLTFSHLGD